MSVRPPAGVAAQLAWSTRLSSLGTSGSRMYWPKLATSLRGLVRLNLSLSCSGMITSLISGQPSRDTWAKLP